jgi:hypothetical protein
MAETARRHISRLLGASRFFNSYAQADEAAVRRARGLAAM